MRTTHLKARLLPLLLFSMHLLRVCFASSCSFDKYVKDIGPPNTVTAKAQNTGKDWEPIRIVTSTKDLQIRSKYCEKKNGLIVERGTEGVATDCEDTFLILNAEKTKIVMGILERVIALHTDRLLVKRVVGPLVIPPFPNYPLCRYFIIPAKHHTTGVANADMVLYVGVSNRPIGDDGAPSLGVTCAKSADGRPIAGTLHFGPYDMDISRHTVRFTAHQIAHALGFSYSEMNSRKMIMDKKVRGKTNPVSVVRSDKTKKMTQEHYGCPTAEGMELEDGEDIIKKSSHWERRNAKDELMSKPIGERGTSFMGFYTSLTMATFEDMGFYKANFEMAEHMEYGHKVGCEFLDGKCMKDGKKKWPHLFCDVPESGEKTNVCTTDRLGLGACALKTDYSSPLLEQFQYFASNNKGGVSESLTDYCPVVEQHPFFACTNSGQNGKIHGSRFGKNSMCLDGSALNVKTSNGATVAVAAVCAEILCEGNSVKVKYLGDPNTWHDCPEGKSLTPSSTLTSFVSGTIKCPKYKEVCTVAPDGSSLVPKKSIDESIKSPTSTSPTASQKPTGQPNNSNSGGKSKDGSSVLFGLTPFVAFLSLPFAGYLIV